MLDKEQRNRVLDEVAAMAKSDALRFKSDEPGSKMDGHVLTLRNGRKLNITHYPGDVRKPGFLPLRHMYGNIRGTYG